jgi:hypothetical protein
MLSDELGQVVLLHSGMDDTHPITTPLSRAVVVKSRVGSGRVGSGRVQRTRNSQALTATI